MLAVLDEVVPEGDVVAEDVLPVASLPGVAVPAVPDGDVVDEDEDEVGGGGTTTVVDDDDVGGVADVAGGVS